MTLQFDIKSRPENGPESYVLHMDSVLISAAAGDALGWMTESIRDAEQLRNRFGTDWLAYYREWSKPEGGRRGYMDRIRRGDYSDDTQLTFATGRSLRANGTLDTDLFAQWHLPAWLDYDRGAGAATLAAARAFRDKAVPWNKNFYTYVRRHEKYDYRDAGGNGVAMRVAPIALANLSHPDLISEGVWRSAITTHGHPRAAVGALLYAHAIRFCFIRRQSVTRRELAEELTGWIERAYPPPTREFEEWLNLWNRRADTFFDNLLEKVSQEAIADLVLLSKLPSNTVATRRFMERMGCFAPETKGSGTGTVLAALAIATQERDDIQQAIPWTVNQLGSDTDTIGAFVGGLCGAIYGEDFSKSALIYELQDLYGLEAVGARLGRIVRREESYNPGPAVPNGWTKTLPKVPDSISSGEFSEGDWVFHHLFGRGKVQETATRPLRNQPDRYVRLLRAEFNNSQSYQFRTYLPEGSGP